MRALVVEDDPASRRLAERLLHDAGYDVDGVGDATTARARVASAEGQYDLVVLDFVLPDSDGLQLLREWRDAGHVFPTLALTGAESDNVVEGFLRAGANDVIEKARFSAATLRAALDGLAEPTPFPRQAPGERARAPPEPQPTSDADDDPAADALPQGRALVVDDTALARRNVLALLRRVGWHAEEASTAHEGLQKALAMRFDVILVDQYLPDTEGIGLLEELRRRRLETPVVALTGHGDEKLATEYLLAGAADFIPKHTLTATRLREALQAALQTQGALRAGDPDAR